MNLSQVEIEFIESQGLSMQADGLPRIAGRMFGLLLLVEDPISFSDIAELLKVSRGSISTNGRLLVSIGMIERVSQPGDRQDYFRIRPDPFAGRLEGYQERHTRNVETVTRILEVFPDTNPVGKQRVLRLQRFYRHALTVTRRMIKEWQDGNER